MSTASSHTAVTPLDIGTGYVQGVVLRGARLLTSVVLHSLMCEQECQHWLPGADGTQRADTGSDTPAAP